jgi:hypothetical protein
MSEKERIVAAAIRANGVVFSEIPPARHHTILHAIDSLGLNPIEIGAPNNQGFITSTGRFVQRRQAAGIAVEAGQIDAPKWGAELYSEDLW